MLINLESNASMCPDNSLKLFENIFCFVHLSEKWLATLISLKRIHDRPCHLQGREHCGKMTKIMKILHFWSFKWSGYASTFIAPQIEFLLSLINIFTNYYWHLFWGKIILHSVAQGLLTVWVISHSNISLLTSVYQLQKE